MLIRLGHSPDPDDAFMFWALAAGAIDTRGFEFEHVLQDIQTLSAWALEGRLETTAMSLASYPLVQDRYAILPHGASMGSGYGPIVVGRRTFTRDVLRESIRAGLDNREEAMRYALEFGRGLDLELADRFVGMYVNELTEDYGDEGRHAVEELLRRAQAIGHYREPVRVEFVS